MEDDDLIDYVCLQIANFFPDKWNGGNRGSILAHLPETLSRLAVIADKVTYWRRASFDPLSSSQYCQFLYVLANTIWAATGEERLATKLFLLNKALHAIDLFFKVEMPPVFIIGHGVGIVLGRATYGNFFAAFQNSTVGRVGNNIPVIGDGVLMFPNTAIVGRCDVGSFTVLSQGTSLINRDSPGNVTLSGPSDHLSTKLGRSRIYRHYFRDVDFV